MIKVYAVNILDEIAEEHYKNLLSYVSPEKQARIQKFRFQEDAKRSLYGDLLTRYLICTNLGINNDQIKFITNQYGKPYLKGFSQFDFNISHSGDWVVCAVSDKGIGIDVEQIKPVNLHIAKRFFSKTEYIDLTAKPVSLQEDYFYNLWTLKESYIKYKGKGLSMPLDSFAFVIHEDKIELTSQDRDKLYFKLNFLDHAHKAALCSERECTGVFIEMMNVNNLSLA